MDSINITVTGRLGADPRPDTTKAGKPWASFTLAADVPMRNGSGEREYDPRWYQVWCHGPLAERVADSLAKGDRMTVRADGGQVAATTGRPGVSVDPRLGCRGRSGEHLFRGNRSDRSRRWSSGLMSRATSAAAGACPVPPGARGSGVR